MIVTVKYHDDGIQFFNSDIAEICNMKPKELNGMERYFLQILDYNLTLSRDDVERFISQRTLVMNANNKACNSIIVNGISVETCAK
jgi:hypothetical protein